MAYNFKDAQGNWRTRYDDGTTSPALSITPHGDFANSTTSFSEASFGGKASRGVDTAYGDSQQALMSAIIEKAASDDRIATYQREFMPLAETANGQDMLINRVFSNPSADIEARLAAAQALYPGMKAEVGVNGEMSFSAKNSDLGFNYPDKTASQLITDRMQNTERATGSKNLDYNETSAAITGLINNMASASDVGQATTMMTDALATITDFRANREAHYKDIFKRQYDVEGLEKAVTRNQMLDTQYKMANPWARDKGASYLTQQAVSDFTVADTRFKEELDSAMANDSELTRMRLLESQVIELGKRVSGDIATTPTLIPAEDKAVLDATFNKDGSPLSEQQLRELDKGIANNDPRITALRDVMHSNPGQMPSIALQLPPSLRDVAGRMFNQAVGDGGTGVSKGGKTLFDNVVFAMENFYTFASEAGIGLTKDQRDILEAANPKIALDKDTMAMREAEANRVKREAIEDYYRSQRDQEGLASVLDGSSVPGDGASADIWRKALVEARGVRDALVRSDRMQIEREWAVRDTTKVNKVNRLKEFDSQIAERSRLNLNDVMRAYVRQYQLSGISTGDVAQDTFVISDALTSWLSSQAAQPKLKNWLGPNKLLEPNAIQGVIIDEFREQSLKKSKYF